MGHVELLEKATDGRFRVVTSIHKWYQIENETPVIILKITKILQDSFNFSSKKPISGMDETAGEVGHGLSQRGFQASPEPPVLRSRTNHLTVSAIPFSRSRDACHPRIRRALDVSE